MAYDYNKTKQLYEWLNDDQKQQFAEMNKNDSTWNYQKFMQQYNAEMNNNQQSNNNSSNFNNQNGTNWQNQQNFDTPTVQKTESQNNNQNNQTYNYDPEEKLDTDMFKQSDGKVVVKEWTAQQTGLPDYQLDSDARTREITDNLNAYWQTNREYFQDRNTYNNMFHYNERSDQQKAVLDSYWKKKEDMNVAEKYNTADGIKSWMNDADITPDQLNYIKEYSPEAYKEWQQKQIDDINLRIANLATPADPTSNAELFNSLLTKLGLEPWDPYQIYDNWYDMAERLWVFSDSEKLKSYQNQLDQNHSKMESIMGRYANSTWGTVSDALAAARMNKALAPYQQREVDLQNSYTTLLNGRNSNLAIANQSAQALAMQAQEDQRIWNQRLQGLGFAMNTAEFRTYEQKAQTDLYKAQALNSMELLQQAQLKDINRYDAYATAKMKNQLQQELTDLSVEDEAQLKANLNNALKAYYDERWAIIQRPQAEVVEDVIAYAKKNWITVAEALRKNFVEPLQSKKEYKTKVAQDYWMDKYQQQYSYTIDGDWNIKISASWYGEIPESAFKTRAGRQEAYGDVYENSVNWESYVQNLAWSIKDWSYGWQCGAFCNDVLVAWGDSKIFWNTLQDKIKACNVKKEDWPQVWYAVVFDLWFTSKDWENHGHVWVITNVNGDGSIDVLESNGKSDETIHVKTYSKAVVDKMVMGYYKPSNYDVQKWTPNNYASYVEENADKPYEWVSKTTKTWVEVNAGWWITDLEERFMDSTRMSDSERKDLYDKYWIDIVQYNAMKKKYVDYQAKVSLIEDTQKMYDAVKDLLEWNKEYSSKWRWSRHSGTIDRATFDTIDKGTETKNIFGIFPKFDNETANWINKYNYLKNSQLLDKYQQLKKAWATFWAMQKSEWDLVWSAASDLNWQTTDAQFEETLQKMLDHYGNILADAGVEWFYNTDI